MDRNWYAVYTKTHCEKKVAASLAKKKIEGLCPLNKIISTRGNRTKMLYAPLFPSFVFVHIPEAAMQTVRQVSDVINFVYWLGKPAVIRPADIESIISFTNSHSNIKLDKTAVNIHGIIKLTSEPQLDIEKGIVSLTTIRLRLSLPSLGFVLIAETEKTGTNTISYDVVNSRIAS